MQVKVFHVLFFALLFAGLARGQTSMFTYQGSLKDGSNPANGNYDLEFRMFDTVSGGAQQGATLQRLNVAVANGSFTVSLDFGAAVLPGADRFLDISVRTAGGGAFTPLIPRQKITSTPYAIKSANAASADAIAASCVGCVSASHIGSVNGASVSGAIPVASIPAGSGSYIQNTTSPQASSNFNISGTGTAFNLNAFVVTATGQFNFSGNRILAAPGTNNLVAGIDAGASLSGGGSNTFFGRGAGQDQTSAIDNSFFGAFAGTNNTNASNNSFFGAGSGGMNTSGGSNSFFGTLAGSATTLGGSNAYFGAFAGDTNTTGANNSVFGSGADLGSGNLSFATAIGSGSTVSTSNTIALGRSSGIDDVHVYGDLRAASIDSSSNYSINDATILANPGSGNLFAGVGAGGANSGSNNSFFGRAAGSGNTTGGNNTFIGHTAGDSNTTGSFNTLVGQGADVAFNNLSHATAIGAGSFADTPNSIVLGRPEDTVKMRGNAVVYGDYLYVDQLLMLRTLGAARSTHLCWDESAYIVSACSSSIRFKKDVAPFTRGMELLNQLKPVTYNWKQDDAPDLGLIAEEVAKAEPRFATYDKDGQVQGVKYDQLTIVLINAVKEQQAQIDELKKQLRSLKPKSSARGRQRR